MQNEKKLDQFDLKILRCLLADGRMAVTELAPVVGLSKTACQMRLKRLRDTGVIEGFRAVVAPHALGHAHIAFVEVKLSDTREKALQAFNAAVRAVPQIEECHMIAGSFDYLLKVRSRDIAGYRTLLGEVVSSLPHVSQTSTHVVMQAVKDAGQLALPG